MMKRGSVIAGRYIVKEVLGTGGSSEVYLAGEVEKEKLYTLKVSRDKELLKREAMLTGEINSRYFPAFVDYEEDESYAYLFLEYIEGVSLQKLLNEGRKFTEKEIYIIMEHVTAALSVLHLHRTPLVHLDIKPANIIISPKGEVRIIDMGAGGIVGNSGMKKGGTYGYGAPEQFWQGALPGPAADVYACGKLMLYLLTGKNPAHPPYDVETKMLSGRGGRGQWKRLIAKCLEMEPGRRYPDGGILHKEIRKIEEGKKRKIDIPYTEDVVYVKCLWKSDYERI